MIVLVSVLGCISIFMAGESIIIRFELSGLFSFRLLQVCLF